MKGAHYDVEKTYKVDAKSLISYPAFERPMTSIDSEELSEYIQGILNAAKQGTKDTDFYVDGTIDIEVSVINTKKAEGGIKIFVAGAKGEYSNDTMSKIKISLRQQRGVGAIVIKDV